MGNMVCIMPTIFIDDCSGIKSYGARIFDNYGKSYFNDLETIPDDDIELLEIVVDQEDEVIKGIISYVEEKRCGIYIDTIYYGWDEIKDTITRH